MIKTCKYCGKSFLASSAQKYCGRSCANLYRLLFNTKTQRNTKIKDTLCWNCKKATAGYDCPWANEFKPVEGWKATRTSIGQHYRKKDKPSQEIESFVVRECPLFERG